MALTFPWTRGTEAARAANNTTPAAGMLAVTNEGNVYAADGSTAWSAAQRLAKASEVTAAQAAAATDATTKASAAQTAATAAAATNAASVYLAKNIDRYRIANADVATSGNVPALLATVAAAAQADNVSFVSLPAGVLDMPSQFSIPGGKSITFEGRGEDTVFRQTVASYGTAMFSAATGTDGTKYTLTTDLAANTITLTLPSSLTATLAVGDRIGLESNAVVFGVGTGTQEGLSSEFRTVQAVSGTTVQIDGPLIWPYLIADGAVAWKLNLSPPVRLANMRITTDNPATHNWRAISLNRVRDLLIENVTLDNAGGGIYITDCMGGEINNVNVNRLQTVNDFRGYGVAMGGRSAEIFINDLRGRYMRHLFTTVADQRGSVQWGGPRNIQINNGIGFASQGDTGYATWDTHPYGYDITFNNCHAFGGLDNGSNGFQIRSIKTKIINPVVGGIPGVGIVCQPMASDIEIVGGEIGNCDLQAIKVASPNVRIRNMRIFDNAVSGTLGGISYAVTATGIQITDNLITGNGAAGIKAATGTTGTGAGTVIRGNVIPKSSVQLNSITTTPAPAVVSHNVFTGYGAAADGMNFVETGAIRFGNVTDGATDPASSTPNVQTFTASGTWTKPTSGTTFRAYLVAGGGGGGSGRRGAAATIRSGGAGGGGGAKTYIEGLLSDLASTLTVTIGAAGTSGAAVTTDSTDGNAGGAGGATIFGPFQARGGTGGGGGTATSATGGTAGSGTITGSAGGNSTTGGAGTAGGSSQGGATGGGGGGGITAGDVEGAGGAGNFPNDAYPLTTSVGGVVPGGAGGAGGSRTTGQALGGEGGAGGAASKTTAGGAGGAGGLYGAGGGGGGASLNGFASGAGGVGAAGIVVVICQ